MSGELWGTQPAPEPEQLQQVVAGADEQSLPVYLFQAPQQELPEASPLLDLPEHRLHRLFAQPVALPSPFRSQLPPHPVPGGEIGWNPSPGSQRYCLAVAGLLRRNERVHSQGMEFINRAIAS